MSFALRLRRFSAAIGLAVAAVNGAPALAQNSIDLLPRRPEIVVRESKDGSLRYTVRGRDCPVSDFLAALAERGTNFNDEHRLEIVSDERAQKSLKATLATVELYDRRAEQIVELLAAVAGVDFDIDSDGMRFKLVGPPKTGNRPLLRNAIEQFYKMALARQGDDYTASRSLRGLADVLRAGGDNAGAYGAYEQLLAEHPASPFAHDAELLLADCYMELDQNSRANQLLRSFLAKCADPKRAELALRRLVTLLLEQRRYHELVTMHEAFERLGILQGETLSALADAGAVMLDQSDADVATLLLGTFRMHPVEHAMLGPVLALAFAKKGDDESSRIVLEKAAESIGNALDSTSALLAYSELSRRAGHYAAALLFAQRAVNAARDNPILRRRANLLLADVYDALGDASRVYHHLWEAEQLSSVEDAPKLALRAAEFAMEQSEPEHARLLFQSAAQYKDSDLDAALGVARALLLAGTDADVARAVEQLRDLRVMSDAESDRRRIGALLAECHMKAGRYDQALAALEDRDDESTMGKQP